MNYKKSLLCLVIILIIFTSLGGFIYQRYTVSPEMIIPVKEFDVSEYPDNPATLSYNYGKYSHKQLLLTKEDAAHFTFTFLPSNKNSATIALGNIDVGLMTPSLPEWVKGNSALTRIALTDRQWNRQQVLFDPHSVEIKGGDGFEKDQTYSIELAKNCLNAGLWEIQFFTNVNGQKELYYQGWFSFPLGYYRQIVEHNTKLPYWKVWYFLERWDDPEGTFVDVSDLRKVVSEKKAGMMANQSKSTFAQGEQINKRKNIMGPDIKVFRDYLDDAIHFATFTPPGLYRKDKPWNNEFWRIQRIKQVIQRDVISPANPRKVLQEVEIVYDDKEGKSSHFYISGFEQAALPQLSTENYDQAPVHLMGIGTPPLKQTYEQLVKNPPQKIPFFSVFLSNDNEWINHHEVGIDGVILFRDAKNLLNICMVSYERHAIIGHYILK